MGHPASGKQFGQDVLKVLKEDMAEETVPSSRIDKRI